MIAELVKQYDTLKRCNAEVPDPYFKQLEVWVEIILKSDDSFYVNWIGKPKETPKDKKPTMKEEGDTDVNCPVTENSTCRSSGNDSPHGLVDNAMWIFGKFATEKQKQKSQTVPRKLAKGKQSKDKIPSDEARRQAYLSQIKAFYDYKPDVLGEVKTIYDCLSSDAKRNELWIAIEKELKDKIIDWKGGSCLRKTSISGR